MKKEAVHCMSAFSSSISQVSYHKFKKMYKSLNNIWLELFRANILAGFKGLTC